MGERDQPRFAGRFELDREVGRGAAGVVYRARDAVTGAPIALKVISDPSNSSEETTRFAREGELLGGLAHPNIVGVFAYGALDEPYVDGSGRGLEAGTAYVAMEWLEGEDLAARQRRSPLGLAEAVEVARQIAEALAFAHEAGIVHRDVKPSNVFLAHGVGSPREASGFSTLRGATGGSGAAGGPNPTPADECLARPSQADVDAASTSDRSSIPRTRRSSVDDGLPEAEPAEIVAKLLDFGVAAAGDASLAGAGAIVGTPAYMAPEQAAGDGAPDARSDIYSLGATLFELCVGRPPHAGPSSVATLARRVTGPAPRLGELLLDVPERLDDLVARLLELSPADRPQTAREVADALAALGREETIRRAPRPLLREATARARVGTRLITTIVALGVAVGDARRAVLDELRALEVDPLPLGADSVIVHLGATRAHGDEASRAIEIGERLAALGARVGIATGRTLVDLTAASGEIVDRAAKLAREAKDGRPAHDLTTLELARGRLELDVGSRSTSAPVTSFTKRGRSEKLPSSFVGREGELLAATGAFDRSVDERAPVVVSVSGPPGIGKSRLAQELLVRIESRPEAPRVLFVRCESYARTAPLGTASDALRSLMELPKGCALDASRAALERFLGDTGRASVNARDLELLARLLANQPLLDGREPGAARDALYVAMTDLALFASTRGATAIAIEDAQWADPESIAWLDHLLGRATGRSLFVLVLARPAFWRAHPQRFAAREHVRIELKPMPKRAVRELARTLIGPKATDEQLDQVTEQSAGSPLFAEELARLVAQGKGVSAAPTIEAAIQVSLDALDDVARDAAARMSVFGLASWEAGLGAVWDGAADELPGAIARLVANDTLVENKVTRFTGTREVLFKHALVRDVAYATLGDDLRKSLHARAAAWLASVGEDAALVAHHYDEGGRCEEAATHWESAARRALATNGLSDAASMAERALAFADDRPTGFGRASLLEEAHARLDPRGAERGSAIQAMRDNVFDEESELCTEGAEARYDDARAQGYDIEARLRRVRDRAIVLGIAAEGARSTAALAQRLAFAGELAAAEQEANAMLELARGAGLEWSAVDAWQTLGVVHQARGEIARALEARRNAARAARSAGLQEREATLTMNLGFALTTVGARNEALVEIETGLAKAQAIGSVGAVRHGQMNLLGWAAAFGAEPRIAHALSEPRAQADEAAAGGWVIQDRTTLGVLYYRGLELLRGDDGSAGRARGLLERAAHAYRSTSNLDILPVCLGFWSEAERRLGDADKARALAEEATALLDQGAASLLNEAPAYLSLHDACVDLGDLASAKQAVERGLPHLARRLAGLEGTAYAHSFVSGLTHNAGLIAAAENYGLVPEAVRRALGWRT